MAYGDYSTTITRRSGGATLTFSNTSPAASKLSSPPIYERQQNYAIKVTLKLDNNSPTATNNIMLSTFAGWSSGTGALSEGDYLSLQYWPTGDTAIRTVATRAVITEIGEDDAGVLSIIAYDYLKTYENLKPGLSIFQNHRDLYGFNSIVSTGRAFLDAFTDNDIVQPLEVCQYASGAVVVLEGGNGTPGTDEQFTYTAYGIAQPFIAQAPGLVRVHVDIRYDDAINTNFTLSVHLNDQNWGDRPGQMIASELVNKTDAGARTATLDFTFISGTALYLNKGDLYWLQLKVNAVIPDTFIQIEGASPDDGMPNYYAYQVGADSWTAATGNWAVLLDFANYEDIYPVNYFVDETANKLYLNIKQPNAPHGDYMDGRCSYYYGSVTHQTVCEKLIGYNHHAITPDCSANQVETFGVYHTANKSIADALRVLSEIYQTSGSWIGSQTVIAHHYTSTVNYVKCSRRLNIDDDASVRTFSHASVAGADNEARIIKCKLKKKSTSGISEITVQGQDFQGKQILFTTHNYAKSGSIGAFMRGFTIPETYKDGVLKSLQEGIDAASAQIAASNVDKFYGSIVVSGCFPDLVDWDPTSATYGSGKIVTLNYPKLGLVAAVFKVTGVMVDGNSTEIYLTNTDPLYENYITSNTVYRETQSNFYAPIGVGSNKYRMVYDSNVVSTATLYMSLQLDAGTELTQLQRIRCPKIADAQNNLNIYHAEFIVLNGYHDSPVGIIRLYDAETGGSLIATADLYTAASNDRRLYKWKGDRLIVDYTCKAS